MADEHDVHHHEGNSMGFVMGIIFLIVALFLFVYYLLPAVQNSKGTSINVPDKIDVNVNQPK